MYSRRQRLAAREMVSAGAAPEGVAVRAQEDAEASVGRDRAARRRPGLRASRLAAAHHRARRATPLLADLRGRRGEQPADRHPYCRLRARTPIPAAAGSRSTSRSTSPSRTALQSVLTSLVFEGVFERFPKLKVILVEGGFAWAPPLMWRLDREWQRHKGEVPHVKRPPSEYVREHFWFTTQPIEEPETNTHLLDTLRWIGPDRLMFSTDYPHWDFDDPRFAFKVPLLTGGAPPDLPRQRQDLVWASTEWRATSWPASTRCRRGRRSVSSSPAATLRCST